MVSCLIVFENLDIFFNILCEVIDEGEFYVQKFYVVINEKRNDDESDDDIVF